MFISSIIRSCNAIPELLWSLVYLFLIETISNDNVGDLQPFYWPHCCHYIPNQSYFHICLARSSSPRILSCPDLCWAVLSCVELSWRVLSFLGCPDISWPMQTSADLCWAVLSCPDLCWSIQTCAELSCPGHSCVYPVLICDKLSWAFMSCSDWGYNWGLICANGVL